MHGASLSWQYVQPTFYVCKYVLCIIAPRSCRAFVCADLFMREFEQNRPARLPSGESLHFSCRTGILDARTRKSKSSSLPCAALSLLQPCREAHLLARWLVNDSRATVEFVGGTSRCRCHLWFRSSRKEAVMEYEPFFCESLLQPAALLRSRHTDWIQALAVSRKPMNLCPLQANRPTSPNAEPPPPCPPHPGPLHFLFERYQRERIN